MGRALFSEKYGTKTPAIRVQPEPVVCPYAKWSISNRFDPDAEEFFDSENAVFEAFLDRGEVDLAPVPVLGSGLSSSDSSDSGHESTILELSQSPIHVSAIWDHLADEGATATAEELLLDIPGYTRTMPFSAPDAVESEDLVTIHATSEYPRPVPISVHPPSALRNSTTATDLALAAPSTPSPRRISVSPINIPVEPSTPSPASPASPTTPPAVYAHVTMMTPSPPPTVSPRIYMWGRTHTPASPGSPSVRYTHSPSPLGNHSARQSLARITTRRRAQNV